MKTENILYQKSDGWSVKDFPDMDSERTLIFVFGAPMYAQDHAAIEELCAKYPKSKIVGCSSAGEIYGTQVYDESLAVAICQFDKTDIKVSVCPIDDPQNSFKVGEEISKELADDNLSALLVLSDGLKVNGSTLVEGINSKINMDKVIVTGGLAGDGSDFKQTWVIKDGKPTPDHVSVIGFYGDSIEVGHASKGGWDIFGPERKVTKSEGNVLYELDGRPALELYKEYLGDKAKELPASGLLFPLLVRSTPKDDKGLVRTILAIDEENQTMTFAGDIEEGHFAQLMRANFDRLIEGASDAANTVTSATGPVLCVSISCVGRRLVLGERTDEEVEAILDVLPEGSKQVGFYSYGELSPYVEGKPCELHNQTMTITTIKEK